MPELPEVETTLRGIRPFLLEQQIISITVRQEKLRQKVPSNLSEVCANQTIRDVSRRAKYILIHLHHGALLIHLGMSGHLHLVKPDMPLQKHAHIDLLLSNGVILRYQDPRRFGLWLYLHNNINDHPLLKTLGPEPLDATFHTTYLFKRAQNKKQSIKALIMDSKMVVGVGNIYASESLFSAHIHPLTPAGHLTMDQSTQLVLQIKKVLQQAIEAGGTTLRDFFASDGKPGYFANQLQVYGRHHLPCSKCHTPIQSVFIAGRNSFFCPTCQPLIENI